MITTFLTHCRVCLLVAGLGLAGACSRRSTAVDIMSVPSRCETAHVKSWSRPTKIPETSAVQGFGTLVGVVVQRETGDALASAGVRLVSEAGNGSSSKAERPTDAMGGFKFDSLAAGQYWVLVRRIGEDPDSLLFTTNIGRLDTVRVSMKAARVCHGY